MAFASDGGGGGGDAAVAVECVWAVGKKPDDVCVGVEACDGVAVDVAEAVPAVVAVAGNCWGFEKESFRGKTCENAPGDAVRFRTCCESDEMVSEEGGVWREVKLRFGGEVELLAAAAAAAAAASSGCVSLDGIRGIGWASGIIEFCK